MIIVLNVPRYYISTWHCKTQYFESTADSGKDVETLYHNKDTTCQERTRNFQQSSRKTLKHKFFDKFISVIYLETFENTIRNCENKNLNFPSRNKNVWGGTEVLIQAFSLLSLNGYWLPSSLLQCSVPWKRNSFTHSEAGGSHSVYGRSYEKVSLTPLPGIKSWPPSL